MKSISEESIFLLKHWSVVEKLKVSIETLEKEIINKLSNMGKELQDKDWWNPDLLCHQGKQYLYFDNKKWEDSIQIGIEDFCSSSLLGSTDYQTYCYLWVTGPKRDVISSALTKILEKDKYFDEYYCSGHSYILKKPFKKYTELDYEEFIKDDSFVEYVEFLEKVYLTIQSYEIPSDS